MILNDSVHTKNANSSSNKSNGKSVYTKGYILGDNSPGLNTLLNEPEWSLYGKIQSLDNRAIDALLTEVTENSKERQGLSSKTRKVDFLYNKILKIRSK